MKRKYSNGLMAVCGVAVLCMCFYMISCRGGSSMPYNADEKQVADSVARSVRNVDSLRTLVKTCENDGNKLQAMMASQQLGKVLRENSEFQQAIEAHHEQFRLAEEEHDTLEMVHALNNIGTNFRRLGIMDEASDYHYKALGYCDTFSDTTYDARKARVTSLNGIGNIMLSLDNKQVADSVFRLALKGEQQLGSPLGQAINYANLGSIYEDRGDLDSARVYFQRSLEQNKAANSNLGISLCYSHFGRLHEKKQEWDKAIEQYKHSYDIMSGDNDKWHWLTACVNLARVYIAKHDLASARPYLDRGKKVAAEIHSIEYLGDLYRLEYKWNKENGDYVAALRNYELSDKYRDSVNNERNLSQIQNVRLRYERDRRQNEIDAMEQNYQNERTQKNVVLIVSVFVLIFALVVIGALWYIVRLRTRNQAIMRSLEKTRINFFTNITHEFRTPLTVILGMSRRLKSGELAKGETMQDVGTLITRQGERLLNLINQLLDISKVRSAIGEPDWRHGNLVAYLRMIVESYTPAAEDKLIELLYVPVENVVDMDFVPDYTQKVMSNLLGNALKFTAAGGRITVRSHIEGDSFVISVTDTGKGISAEALPHIFEEFYQSGDNTIEVGTGIGLSLVRQIVNTLGGSISCESELGKGSTFTVKLQLKHGKHEWAEFEMLDDLLPQTQVEELLGTADMALPEGDEDDQSDAPTILIVDDNTDVSSYIGSQLQEHCHLYYARNGREGFEKALDIVPDIIITDIMMPEVDGYELCRMVRDNQVLNHIPIIIVSARTNEQDRIKGIKAGADAFLYKPFNSNELTVRIDHLLESRRMLRQKFQQVIVGEASTANMGLNYTNQQFVNRLVDVTHAVLNSGRVGVESVAEKMCMSRQQLNRKILAVTGETAQGYINVIRLSNAKRLLDDPKNLSVGDVAQKCGYDDIAYFSRVFKQTFNQTPTQYRRRVK